MRPTPVSRQPDPAVTAEAPTPNLPIRVLHVVPTLGRGGAEHMLTALVTGPISSPAPIRHRVACLFEGGPLADEIAAAGVEVLTVGGRGTWAPLRAIAGLARIIRRWRPDVVQGWLYYGDLAAFAARALAGANGTRLYWSIRCSDLDMRRHGWGLASARWAWIRLASRADTIIANSRAGVAAHQALGLERSDIVVIHNGTDVERFRPDSGRRAAVRAELELDERDPVAVHLARVDPQKDHELLIEVAGLLPRVAFLAAGRGTEGLQGPPNLKLLGERADSPALLAAGDVVISTSADGEGYPNAVAEGMAAGLPAIATDTGDVRELIGACGRIVPRRDAAAIANAVEELLALAADERRALGEAARRRIADNFRAADAVLRFEGLYRSRCRCPPGPG